MRMSPSGKLLAIGGSGLEIFHFNGGNPVTKYKTLLPAFNVAQILWDNNNHMYVIGKDRCRRRQAVCLYRHPDQRHGSARLTLLHSESGEHNCSAPLETFSARAVCATLAKPRWGCSISGAASN